MPRSQSTLPVLAGYKLSRADFLELVASMPRIREMLEFGPQLDLDDCLSQYLFVKGAPVPKLLREAPYDTSPRKATLDSVTSCFFPLRRLHGDRGLVETDNDKLALAKFMAIVEAEGGKLDTTKLSFNTVLPMSPACPIGY